jgi:hemerythrin superfamily protein
VTGPTDPGQDPVVGPEYGGSADRGVVSSVGEHAPAAGDVVDAVVAEHRKLSGVFDEVLALVRADDRQSLALRWGGVVRELLEHEAAEERVVLPAAEHVGGAEPVAQVRRSAQTLRDRVARYDTITVDEVDPQDVAEAIAVASDHLRAVDAAVVPLLQQLPGDERARLGEDLRQVMG